MPPRRRRAVAQKSRAPAPKVHKITSKAQWENMLSKAGDRVVVVQFFEPRTNVCMQMRPYFLQISAMPQFKRAIFAEVNLDEAEEVGHLAGVTRVPAYQCWVKGEVKSNYSGGMPSKVQQLVQEALAEYGGSGGGGLVRRLLTALAAVGVVAAGAYAYMQLSSGGNNSSGELADVKRKLELALERLRRAEMSGPKRAKQAAAQRKIVKQLEARQRALERSSDKSQQPAAQKKKKAAAPAAAAPARPAASAAEGYYSEEEEEGAGQEQGVLYSDEEEEE